MRRLVVLAGVVTVALLAPLAAKAHPLGNFTINRFSRIEVSGHRLYVRYVLDMAEIPTFQARQAGGIDGDAYARRIAAGTRLVVDGQAARLVPLAHVLAFPKGAGGLRTTRLEVDPGRTAPHARRPDRLPRHQLRRPDRLEGDRRRRAHRRAEATSSARTPRTCCRARST